MTQQEIADQAGITRSYLGQVIAGHRLPSVEIALRLGKVLGKNVEELFRLDDGKPMGASRHLGKKGLRT